jgi:hypothetical protein
LTAFSFVTMRDKGIVGAPTRDRRFATLIRSAKECFREPHLRLRSGQAPPTREPAPFDCAPVFANFGVASDAPPQMLLWREGGDDFFEARLASQRIPERRQFQFTIADDTRWTDDNGELFACEILFANPGCD